MVGDEKKRAQVGENACEDCVEDGEGHAQGLGAEEEDGDQLEVATYILHLLFTWISLFKYY